MPSQTFFFPPLHLPPGHGSVWIRGKHTSAMAANRGAVREKPGKGRGAGGLYLPIWSSAKKRKSSWEAWAWAWADERGGGRHPLWQMVRPLIGGEWMLTPHLFLSFFPVPVFVPVPDLLPRGWQPEKKLIPCPHALARNRSSIDEIDGDLL